MTFRHGTAVLFVLAATWATGCGQSSTPSSKRAQQSTDQHGHDHGEHVAAAAHDEAGHDHSGWWCDEHGVPEEVCALCDSNVAAEFQKKGDWCKEHDRPDSQCFRCHPELQAKFAAQYEAKYGKQPPRPEG